MAISLMDEISWKFTGKPWDLNSLPLTPDEVWAKLDLPPEEVRVALNETITELNELIPTLATNEALTEVIAGTVNLVDTADSTKYAWGMTNGLLFLEEVE